MSKVLDIDVIVTVKIDKDRTEQDQSHQQNSSSAHQQPTPQSSQQNAQNLDTSIFNSLQRSDNARRGGYVNDMPRMLHVKCRNSDPTRDMQYSARAPNTFRVCVPDEFVPWVRHWPDYNPTEFTDPNVLKQPVWADPINPVGLHFNDMDGQTNRRSHEGKYYLSRANGRPLNPMGRTGLSGRGALGKWGCNHAADPIATRWKRNEHGQVLYDQTTGLPILQFVAIERADTHEMALPGGMVDPGENISVTLKREFLEECANSLEMTPEQRQEAEAQLGDLFTRGTAIYRGYVDDPRNTDNSWMETVAQNFHDDTGNIFNKFKLMAGDDARRVFWLDINSGLNLYASHRDFVERTAQLHNAYW